MRSEPHVKRVLKSQIGQALNLTAIIHPGPTYCYLVLGEISYAIINLLQPLRNFNHLLDYLEL